MFAALLCMHKAAALYIVTYELLCPCILIAFCK